MSTHLSDTLPGLRGTLSYRVRRGGEVVEEVQGENLVVTGAQPVIAALLGGAAGMALSHIGFGTDGTAPTAGDTTLAGAVKVALGAVTYPASGEVRFAWLLNDATANGMAIREFGLYSADGTLVARKVRSTAIDKTDQITLEGEWTLHF